MGTNTTVIIAAKVSQEAEALSGEILKDIELKRGYLTNVVLKVMRLAFILNDPHMHRKFEQESSGYLNLGKSIEELETDVAKGEAVLHGTYPGTPPGTSPYEKKWILKDMDWAIGQLAIRRTHIHSYVTRKHYEIRFSGLANEAFERIRARVDSLIGTTVPDAVVKLVSVYNNLSSGNSEDWSNAAHSCRRVLQDLADAVFPSTRWNADRKCQRQADQSCAGSQQLHQ